MNEAVLYAFAAALCTWGLTALGAATVVFFNTPDRKIMNFSLGFAAGVMVAASFWSLLQPAIERAELTLDIPAYLVATVGFLFLSYGVDFERDRGNNKNERLCFTIFFFLSIAERGGFPF